MRRERLRPAPAPKLLLMSAPTYLPVIGLERASPIKINTTLSLCAVVGTLAGATILSILIPRGAAPAQR